MGGAGSGNATLSHILIAIATSLN